MSNKFVLGLDINEEIRLRSHFLKPRYAYENDGEIYDIRVISCGGSEIDRCDGTKIISNYDKKLTVQLLEDRSWEHRYNHLDENNITAYHFDKISEGCMLHNLKAHIESYGIIKGHRLRRWLVEPDDIIYTKIHIDNDCKLVIKPANSAKGNNQILLHDAKNLVDVLFMLTDRRVDGIDVAKLDIPKNITGEFTSVLHSRLAELGYHTDVTNTDACFGNYRSGSPIIVEEFIPNIAREYRALHNGVNTYITERKRRPVGDTYTIGSGVNVTKSDTPLRIPSMDELLGADIEDIIPHHRAAVLAGKYIAEVSKLPFFSFDLYETEDGEFGVFEFQLQFGTEGYPTKFMDNFVGEAYAHILGIV